MSEIEINSLDWEKMNGLIPAVIQHAENGQVLMLSYMNEEALLATLTTGQLTVYSRSRQRLSRTGDDSGNSMAVQHVCKDRDNASLLIHVIPKGTAGHDGLISSFQPVFDFTLGFLDRLITLVNQRAEAQDESSYTAGLLATGTARCAQKVGEEAVETVIAALTGDRDELMQETADLVFHLLVLLKASELSFYDVLQCLQERDRSVHT